jgi:hypothetical protein
VSPGKEVILSAQGQWADFVLDMIIVDEQTPILEQGCQGGPLILGIGEGLTNGALRGDIHALMRLPSLSLSILVSTFIFDSSTCR